MANQLAEYDGEELIDNADDNEDGREGAAGAGSGGSQGKKGADSGAQLIDKEEQLNFKLSGHTITLTHKNLDRQKVTLSYYTIDLEVFFSKKPFLSSISDDFSYLRAVHTENLTLSESVREILSQTVHEVPKELHSKNVYVSVSSQ